MSEHTAQIIWQRQEQNFLDNLYSRKHIIRFDGGVDVPASSSPHVVPLPYSDASAVDPEEMMVAAIANCHMLWFLSMAVKQKFCVDSYTDNAAGIMQPNQNGKLFLAEVTLNPDVKFSGEKIPTHEQVEAMHHQAHEECFIANSVLTKIICKPVVN